MKSAKVEVAAGGEVFAQLLIYGLTPREVDENIAAIMTSIGRRRGFGQGVSVSPPVTILRRFAVPTKPSTPKSWGVDEAGGLKQI